MDLRDWGIEQISHRSLLDTAWQLRGDVTAYNALYVAAARAGGVAGHRRRSARACPGSRCRRQQCSHVIGQRRGRIEIPAGGGETLGLNQKIISRRDDVPAEKRSENPRSEMPSQTSRQWR